MLFQPSSFPCPELRVYECYICLCPVHTSQRPRHLFSRVFSSVVQLGPFLSLRLSSSSICSPSFSSSGPVCRLCFRYCVFWLLKSQVLSFHLLSAVLLHCFRCVCEAAPWNVLYAQSRFADSVICAISVLALWVIFLFHLRYSWFLLWGEIFFIFKLNAGYYEIPSSNLTLSF